MLLPLLATHQAVDDYAADLSLVAAVTRPFRACPDDDGYIHYAILKRDQPAVIALSLQLPAIITRLTVSSAQQLVDRDPSDQPDEHTPANYHLWIDWDTIYQTFRQLDPSLKNYCWRSQAGQITVLDSPVMRQVIAQADLRSPVMVRSWNEFFTTSAITDN